MTSSTRTKVSLPEDEPGIHITVVRYRVGMCRFRLLVFIVWRRFVTKVTEADMWSVKERKTADVLRALGYLISTELKWSLQAKNSTGEWVDVLQVLSLSDAVPNGQYVVRFEGKEMVSCTLS